MEFSSLYFLYLFLPLTLLVYFLVPGLRLKNIVLLAASLLFYAMGQPVYVLLLVGLSYANFAMARCIRPGKRNTLFLPVVVNLAVLGLFKYLDFFLGIFGHHRRGRRRDAFRAARHYERPEFHWLCLPVADERPAPRPVVLCLPGYLLCGGCLSR